MKSGHGPPRPTNRALPQQHRFLEVFWLWLIAVGVTLTFPAGGQGQLTAPTPALPPALCNGVPDDPSCRQAGQGACATGPAIRAFCPGMCQTCTSPPTPPPQPIMSLRSSVPSSACVVASVGGVLCARTQGNSYDNNERCSIRIHANATLTVTRFVVATTVGSNAPCDDAVTLTPPGQPTQQYCNDSIPSTLPLPTSVVANTLLGWRTDGILTAVGFTICAAPNSAAPPTSGAPSASSAPALIAPTSPPSQTASPSPLTAAPNGFGGCDPSVICPREFTSCTGETACIGELTQLGTADPTTFTTAQICSNLLFFDLVDCVRLGGNNPAPCANPGIVAANCRNGTAAPSSGTPSPVTASVAPTAVTQAPTSVAPALGLTGNPTVLSPVSHAPTLTPARAPTDRPTAAPTAAPTAGVPQANESGGGGSGGSLFIIVAIVIVVCLAGGGVVAMRRSRKPQPPPQHTGGMVMGPASSAFNAPPTHPNPTFTTPSQGHANDYVEPGVGIVPPNHSPAKHSSNGVTLTDDLYVSGPGESGRADGVAGAVYAQPTGVEPTYAAANPVASLQLTEDNYVA